MLMLIPIIYHLMILYSFFLEKYMFYLEFPYQKIITYFYQKQHFNIFLKLIMLY